MLLKKAILGLPKRETEKTGKMEIKLKGKNIKKRLNLKGGNVEKFGIAAKTTLAEGNDIRVMVSVLQSLSF